MYNHSLPFFFCYLFSTHIKGSVMALGNIVSIEYEGRTIHGWYTIEGGMITVRTVNGSKTAQIGNSYPVESLAKIMLRKLVEEGKGP